MLKFPSIESLRHVVFNIDSGCEYHGLTEKPTIKFRGTVKLHGTNGGVEVDGTSVTAQGRTRELSITSDNYGFAHFVAGHNDDFRLLAVIMSGTNLAKLTIYGEWCGQGIQSKVAISNVPKMFVAFAAFNHTTDEWISIHDVDARRMDVEYLNKQNIYLITQAPTYTVEVDFNNPTPAAELISKYTLEVEDVCPFGTLCGVEGVGEGIVWESCDWSARLLFKSKGEKHKKSGVRTQVAVDPEKVASIHALVDLLLPEWRLEQGISHLRENNIPVANTSTGIYLKWIAQDILKEEADRIAANPFPWKDIQGTIMNRSKDYFLKVARV